jgi:uncharacterized membrane protein YesL
MARIKKQNSRKGFISPFANYWKKENYIFLGLGILSLILGYVLMGQGEWDNSLSLTISPIILLLAYLVFFPLSVFYQKRK